METPISTPTPATTTAPVSTPAPISTPASATPPVTAQPNVQMDAGTPSFAEGGSTDSGGGFFKSLNWIEIGFAVLGVASLTYVIYYYRYKLQQDKLINNAMQRQLDEIKMNLQTSMNGKYKTI